MPVIMPHPFRDLIAKAIKDARAKGDDDPMAMAAAVRAILKSQPDLTISDAYELVNRLLVR